jgi:hypothetical protein
VPPSKSTVAVDGWQVKWSAYSGGVGCDERALLDEPRYYLESCEAGELHTTVTRILRPHLVLDRRTAKATFCKRSTYGDMVKRGGHLSNYKGDPMQMT